MYAKNNLVLVIAHRLNTVKHADNIIVMDQGKVTEQGSFEKLSTQHGVFYNLLNAAKQGGSDE
jgi:ATP-binding cassette subfamily C protein CydD